ncbi:hypothetical protein [Pararhodobacter sp. CCB-MM2]|uniref:hypothetical protein n=1 Tax=Pararhodobacter sp. CCB-MM2 TaxID=1786003 RepID=UPI0018F7CA60|nr:hypothetical protein [Pararhodobacter sp. CCB-MM2]
MQDLFGILRFGAVVAGIFWWRREDADAGDRDPSPLGEAARVIRNERTKLLANALDRASTACFTVGIATPVAGYIYNISGLRGSLPGSTMIVGGFSWLVAFVLLHSLARRTPGGLQ